MAPYVQTTAACLLLCMLGGCGAVSAVSKASETLDAYTLAPLAGTGSQGEAHLVVEVPVASGGINTDRILAQPSPLQVQYLPEVRWVEPAPVMMQTLLVTSLQNGGSYRLVGRDDAGLDPDYALVSDLVAFQFEGGPAGVSMRVHVGIIATLIRVDDRRIISTRRFDQIVPLAADDTASIIAAFNAATSQVLAGVVGWAGSRGG